MKNEPKDPTATEPSAQQLDPSLLSCMPLFPLPGGVLFPGAVLPLHMFEPRYRLLAEYCVAGPRAMAVASIMPGHDAAYYGAPPVAPIMGAGVLVAQRKLPDGRWNIALRGVGRVRLLHEHAEGDEPFRLAKVEPVAQVGGDDAAAAAAVRTIRTLILEVAQKVPAGTQQLENLLDPKHSAAVLADLGGHAFVTDPAQRQTMLETLDVGERLAVLMDALGRLLLELT